MRIEQCHSPTSEGRIQARNAVFAWGLLGPGSLEVREILTEFEIHWTKTSGDPVHLAGALSADFND